ncbi:class I SAM-dependent methyltransferase [Bacillus salitolerans]|uniref:Class I SAM-dependent methyltransferase n=1 Tax=Bacillus salitolerans TaxID=1437434 RepID=A0ABW4LVT4_9BACI
MNRKDYTEANRKAWNEVNAKHQNAKQEKGKFEKFSQKGYSKLDDTITDILHSLHIMGKDVAQVCCNDGEETISLKNLGASSVTGFDISDEAILSAKELAKLANVECEFVQKDIYEIPDTYNDRFDIVYISVGSLMWFPDINGFFNVIARLLRKNGYVVIYDMHPFILMLDNNEKQHPYEIKYSYFIEEPRMFEDGLDYVGKEKYEASPIYNFDPTLAQIFTGMLQNQLSLILFEEYKHDMSALFEHLNNKELKVPMSMCIVGEKN